MELASLCAATLFAVHGLSCLDLPNISLRGEIEVRSDIERLQECEMDLSVLHLALYTCRSARSVVLHRPAGILFSSVSVERARVSVGTHRFAQHSHLHTWHNTLRDGRRLVQLRAL